MIERSPRAPVLRSIVFLAIAPRASSATVRSTPSIEQPLILLHQRVLRLREDALEGRSSRSSSVASTEPADVIGDEAVLQEILRLDVGEDFALLSILGRDDLGAEADRARPAARRNDLLEASEGAATDEQDVSSVDLRNSAADACGRPAAARSQSCPMILRSACCTPSPDTSRVIERLSDLREILSISSI